MATSGPENSQLKKQPTHVTRKRAPVKLEEKDSVIYVSSKANIKVRTMSLHIALK